MEKSPKIRSTMLFRVMDDDTCQIECSDDEDSSFLSSKDMIIILGVLEDIIRREKENDCSSVNRKRELPPCHAVLRRRNLEGLIEGLKEAYGDYNNYDPDWFEKLTIDCEEEAKTKPYLLECAISLRETLNEYNERIKKNS